MSLDEELEAARERLDKATFDKHVAHKELAGLKKQKWPTKCCRCWPSCIDKDGWCGCCDYDHVTGKRETFADPTETP